MDNNPITIDNFWQHSYVRGLNPRGKLVLVFCMGQWAHMQMAIPEDVAQATNIELSECSAWIEQFSRQLNGITYSWGAHDEQKALF